ncbi:MAG: riboflavin kinase [Candidatus Peregrinibacteria bacterium]|nr:riboflavin kinase [Candidatus Peregrinibacteria bacterium]
MWHRRKVQHGEKMGQKLGFPTLNFRPGNFGDQYAPGVYAAQVRIADKNYSGALYFGPKFSQKGNVLELFVLNFSRTIYGRFVSFKVGKQVRAPMKFDSVETLKKQIEKDIEAILRTQD